MEPQFGRSGGLSDPRFRHLRATAVWTKRVDRAMTELMSRLRRCIDECEKSRVDPVAAGHAWQDVEVQPLSSNPQRCGPTAGHSIGATVEDPGSIAGLGAWALADQLLSWYKLHRRYHHREIAWAGGPDDSHWHSGAGY